jgi:hypothetical protein
MRAALSVLRQPTESSCSEEARRANVVLDLQFGVEPQQRDETLRTAARSAWQDAFGDLSSAEVKAKVNAAADALKRQREQTSITAHR